MMDNYSILNLFQCKLIRIILSCLSVYSLCQIQVRDPVHFDENECNSSIDRISIVDESQYEVTETTQQRPVRLLESTVSMDHGWTNIIFMIKITVLQLILKSVCSIEKEMLKNPGRQKSFKIKELLLKSKHEIGIVCNALSRAEATV